MQRLFPRTLNALVDVVAFIEHFAVGQLNPDDTPTVQLIIEEIFTNMVRHGRGASARVASTGSEDLPDFETTSPDEISIRLDRSSDELTIELVDRDSEEFDLRDRKPVDVDAPLEERKPGGLGIHLVKHLVDEIRYHYKDNVSVVTLIKRVAPANA